MCDLLCIDVSKHIKQDKWYISSNFILYSGFWRGCNLLSNALGEQDKQYISSNLILYSSLYYVCVCIYLFIFIYQYIQEKWNYVSPYKVVYRNASESQHREFKWMIGTVTYDRHV